MSAQTKGLAALLAAHGRNGDTELMHVTKGEIEALNRVKRGIDGKDLPRNPKTGLTEANFFRQWAPQIGMGLGAAAGIAAAPFTAGTSLAVTPAVAAALGGAAGGGLGSMARGDDTQTALLNTAAGGVGGYGIGSMAAGLGAGAAASGASGSTGAGLTATPGALPATATAAPADVALTGAPTSTANAFAPGATGATGETLGTTNLFSQSMDTGIKMYEGGAGGTGLQMPSTAGTGLKFGTGTTMAGTNTGAGLQATPEVAKTMGTSGAQGTNWGYLGTKEALGDAIPVGMSAAAMAPGADNTMAETTGVDMSLPGTEVYYTPTGERRTRVIDRPRYGNVNMASGGNVYGQYDGVEEAADGGYTPGGDLNYANGGVARFGGGGGIGFIESIQPGGTWGDVTADAYGVMHKNMPGFINDATPGGFIGATTPGKQQYLRKQEEEEERKRREQQEGIAAALKAQQTADFNQKWSDRYGAPVQMAEGGQAFYTSPSQVGQYRGEAFRDDQGTLRTRAVDMAPPSSNMPTNWGQAFDSVGGLLGIIQKRKQAAEAARASLAGYGDGMASGGVADLGHYSDGGSLLRGPGDGVSDSIPASIEGKRPARLADGEFVIPARAVSELGNGSTEAGSKQLYAMLDRIAAKRKKGKGLAYEANPKKLLPV